MTPTPHEGSALAADGTRVAYRDHGGDGRGLLLLHGGAANLESMDQWAHRLVPARHCVAIDVRCCGQSGDPEHFSLTDAAHDLDAVVDHLGVEFGAYQASMREQFFAMTAGPDTGDDTWRDTHIELLCAV